MTMKQVKVVKLFRKEKHLCIFDINITDKILSDMSRYDTKLLKLRSALQNMKPICNVKLMIMKMSINRLHVNDEKPFFH
jgi:hypothetical protein